jgi:AraC-like DNA-binding protein
MIPSTFATHSLPAAEQFEAWRSWYAPVFDSAPRQPVEQGFRAKAVTWMLDGFTLSRVSAPPVNGRRTRTHIRRNPVDHWVVTFYRRGDTRIEMPTSTLEPGLGLPFIVSLGDEVSTQRCNDNDRVQLHLGRDRFQSLAPMLDAARGHSLDTASGRLLADYMLLLERNLPALTPQDAPSLRSAVQAMIEACLAPSAQRMIDASGQINVTLMERVRRAVGKHLRSPSLGPDKLCRETAMSRSQLYRVLEGEGGVARYIKRRRLSESLIILCDEATAFPIHKIAEMLCFADASAFSRAFRQEFGMTPGEVRAASLGGVRPAISPLAGDRSISTFDDCLRSF